MDIKEKIKKIICESLGGMILPKMIEDISIGLEDIRYYKGKYGVFLIDTFSNRSASVIFLEDCNFVGNKKVGYKQVKANDFEIINNYRLLYRNKRD